MSVSESATCAEVAYREMYDFAADLFPIPRSLTGPGTRETLRRIGERVPELEVREVPSGTRCFDWEVPDEWSIREAYLVDPAGSRLADFAEHNLHVVGYSVPVDRTLSLAELEPHLHSRRDRPAAIPYTTSYYSRHWGFCLPHEQRSSLVEGRYRAVIDSTLGPGSMSYGEVVLRGGEEGEVLLSTNICHPSMANNELSGPVVLTALAQWLSRRDRRFTYRLVFIPETIGAIAYLSRNLESLRRNVVAGWVVTCAGDDRQYSLLSSRWGDTLADRITGRVLAERPALKRYPYLVRGSDERQYCLPGVDLPVVCVSRTKFYEYPEYHTSLDDLSLISPEGLGGMYEVLKSCIERLELEAPPGARRGDARDWSAPARVQTELDWGVERAYRELDDPGKDDLADRAPARRRYRLTTLGEPRLGSRGLYPTLHTQDTRRLTHTMMNVIAYSDGMHDVGMVAERIAAPVARCVELSERLVEAGVLERLDRDD